MEIVGNVKTYDWGKLGNSSEVAKLATLNSADFVADSETPYSELWMGDHPSGPSKTKADGKVLSDLLNDGMIGGHDKLPFLFKVLSIRKALSIQVHPNKSEAERLHAAHPDIYKDPNHKPELAIALTPFLALCGFRPYDDIHRLCHQISPLLDLVGAADIDALPSGKAEVLKKCFSTLMTSDEATVSNCINRISASHEKGRNVFLECEKNHTLFRAIADLENAGLKDIFETLNSDFPNDVGVLALFFLNVIRLQPGESIFLAANEPHAYLDGDCIECMACSDNVIRAGLTPKYKDITTLLRMLNYEAEPPEKKLFKAKRLNSFVELFAPEIKDFAVCKINIPNSEKVFHLQNRKFGSILLVLSGKSILKAGTLPELQTSRGSIVFIPGNCGDQIEFQLPAQSIEEQSNFIAYQAMYNSF